MHDITEWLEGLGLGEYADAFARNRIDARVLPELDREDLRELGIPLGPRKLLLRAIAELRSGDDAGPGASGRAGSEAAPQSPAPRESERRQLTVMFCDLVDSTRLSSRMDPEDYRDVLAAFRSAVSGATQKYDGTIARFLGDGLLVYFGYPQAHEDDPERAVRAGLDIIEAVTALRPRGELELEVRIGVATGLVVAGDMVVEGAAEEHAVLGDTPNLAARLQEIAKPNTIVLSESTQRLVGGRFVLEALAPRSLKGIEQPVSAFRAVSAFVASRFEAAAARGLSTMTGRERELALLEDRWERATHGAGQAVLISGEPGLGKSRVSEEFCARAEGRAAAVVRYQCSPYHTGSAFHPFIEQLQRAAGFEPSDAPQSRKTKLETLAESRLPQAGKAASLLAALLSLPLERDSFLETTPQRQKSETIGAILQLLGCMTARGPVLVIFEDAQWMDPSTGEVLDALIASLRASAMLCVVTCRPEFTAPWTEAAHVTICALDRLGRSDVGRIVESMTGGRSLPPQVLARILERTDGVPLFVEELTKAVLEAGILRDSAEGYVLEGSLSALSIPATLHDSLLARLDRLASVKEVAQTAACIGREFSPELLDAVCPLDRVALDEALERLVDADLIFRPAEGRGTRYGFRHALVQDTAYESLLISKRRLLHARIAEAIEERFPVIASTGPERLAQHYTVAEMAGKAIPYWLAAGRRMLATSSLPEAISHLRNALELTSRIEGARERAERELEVRTVLGAAVMALHGWPSREVLDVEKPTCDLIERGHGTSDAFVNFWNLWVHHGCRAEHQEGLAVVDRMLKLSDGRDEPVMSLISSFTSAMANLWVGNYAQAVVDEDATLERYDPDRDRQLAWQFNHDPRNTLLSWASLRVWAMGSPDKARALSDEAVAHARQVGHPFNLCWTLGNSSVVYGYCGDAETIRARVDELRRIAREQELIFMQAYMAPVVSSVAGAQIGAYAEALDEGSRAEEVWRSVGGRFWSPMVKSCMALACLHLGRSGQAVALSDEAVAQMESTGELMVAEEIYRVAGLARLEHAGDQDSAMRAFDKSLEYSRAHGTRSFELRTAMSMARLLRRQGGAREARHLLAPVYEAFTEGFDTADLKAAKVLLDALS